MLTSVLGGIRGINLTWSKWNLLGDVLRYKFVGIGLTQFSLTLYVSDP